MKEVIAHLFTGALLGFALIPYTYISYWIAFPALIICAVASVLFWHEIKAMNEGAKKNDEENKLRSSRYKELKMLVQEVDFGYGKVYLVNASKLSDNITAKQLIEELKTTGISVIRQQ